ncbi:site-2 protease family protein [Sorangium atrum]|uniref:Site-2 protease family protein n=1 Tax=Sorangium atrum TaxID=2995308 RepID=A0ABT5CBA1_9BACT|nr:site-2 protease family protein [Sorangium aterium]MDC0683253.1 site-2 protease family protein [Sorangium aterium]
MTDDRRSSTPSTLDLDAELAPAAPSSAEPSAAAASPPPPLRWKKNLALFCVTVISVFVAGTLWAPITPDDDSALSFVKALPQTWPFAVPFLSILLAHEFGHYFAARAHGVEASLPYFIPLPVVSPLGTMGAVISMKGRIKSRNALLDIGASGPLAGLAVALPVLFVGLMRSDVHASSGPALQEGRSLLYLLLRRLAVGPIPETHDVFLGPTAMAGWAGLLITAFNLFPVGQLDGGHVAYALFGKQQDRYSRAAHFLMLALFVGNVAYFTRRFIAEGLSDALSSAVANGMPWLTWFGVVYLMLRVGGREHPPTEPGELSPARKAIAVVTLLLFVLLLMPTPFGTY